MWFRLNDAFNLPRLITKWMTYIYKIIQIIELTDHSQGYMHHIKWQKQAWDIVQIYCKYHKHTNANNTFESQHYHINSKITLQIAFSQTNLRQENDRTLQPDNLSCPFIVSFPLITILLAILDVLDDAEWNRWKPDTDGNIMSNIWWGGGYTVSQSKDVSDVSVCVVNIEQFVIEVFHVSAILSGVKVYSDFLVQITRQCTYHSLEQHTCIEGHEEYRLNDEYYVS